MFCQTVEGQPQMCMVVYVNASGVTCNWRENTVNYIFQRPFLRGLFLEELIFGEAYLGREICVSKSIGLAL